MKNTSLRIFAGALCCALSISTLAGCGSSDDPNTLEVMTGMSTGSAQLKAMQTIADKFEEKHPDTTINILPGTTSYEQDLRVRLAGKNPPDIWNTHGWSRDRYANFLEPLQNRPWANRLNDVMDTSMRDNDGAFYALPLDIAVTGIIYNKDVLEEAGVDPLSINDWDDFSDACAAVADLGKTCIGASGKETWTGGNLLDYSAPGMYTDKELNQLKNGEFPEEPFAEIAQMIADWRKQGYFNVDYTSATSDDIARLMATDDLAFAFQANGMTQTVQQYNPDANLGFIAFPSETGDPYLVTGEDYALGVSNTSANKELALEFIDFIAEPENMEIFAPVVNNASAFTDVEPSLGVVTDSYNYWVTEKQTRTIPIFDRVYLPNGMWNTMTTTADGLITGQTDPEGATEQMETSFISLYRKTS